MSDAFDIVIVGGGMVGTALAAMLADTRPNSLSIAVLEPRPPKKPARAFELRVSALSPASRNSRMICRLGAVVAALAWMVMLSLSLSKRK